MAETETILHRLTRRFAADERGATVIEYALIAALVAVAIITSLSALGNSSGGSWAKTSEKIVTTMN